MTVASRTNLFETNCPKPQFFLFIILAITLGIFLRLYQIGGQVVGDDEWHAISVATNSSFKYIFTHFHDADNCIPLTLYYKLLIETLGLNEFGLHSLQLISGILSLIVFPLIMRSVFNQKITIIFSWLLAISPLLVFYSRYARPYMIVVFLSFISIFSFYFWIQKRKLFYVIAYVILAVLASYFNLASAAFVAGPLIYICTLRIFRRRFLVQHEGVELPKMVYLLLVAICLIAGIFILCLPAIMSLQNIAGKVGQGSFELNMIIGSINLFSGCSSYWCSLFLTVLALYGSYNLFQKNKFLFGYLIAIFFLEILFIAVVNPRRVQEPAVFTRYFIVCLPLWILLISIALYDLSKKLNAYIMARTKRKYAHITSNSCLVGILLILLAKSPILPIYKFENNFTNHIDFQSDYTHQTLKTISEKSQDLYSSFYSDLKKTKAPTSIIEYPYLIFWIGNNYHFYQRFHGKKVMIGYNSHSYLSQSAPLMHRDINFRNFVNIENKTDILNSNADYVIIHKNMLYEIIHMRGVLPDFFPDTKRTEEALLKKLVKHPTFKSHFEPARKDAEKAIGKLKEMFGHPFWEDRWITVFKAK